MPAVIYILSLCTFAFGLSEFVVAGLISVISLEFGAPIATVGTAIAAYALGAAIGAPFITALISHWKDKHILMFALLILSVGSVLMSLAPNIYMLLFTRFLVGLGHGFFMAVASDVATQQVDPQRAGRALSVVWIGLTLALAIGVPLGTFLGSIWTWRWVFLVIGILSVLSMLGLQFFMRDHAAAAQAQDRQPHRISAGKSIKAIMQPKLLIIAGIGVLVSIATFSFFSFISPYLLQITGVDVSWLSMAMLLFGVCSIVGNLVGGWLVDHTDPKRSILLGLMGLAVNLLALYVYADMPFMMMFLVGSLGICFFAIVTMLTMLLLKQAQQDIPESSAVAAGLNIASFNLGTALGGVFGAMTIASGGLAFVPVVGACAAVIAMVLLYFRVP